MTAPYSVKTFIKHTFAQRFRLARLTHVPALGRLVDRLLFAGDELFYADSPATDGWPQRHLDPAGFRGRQQVINLKKTCNLMTSVINESGFSFRRGLTADPTVKDLNRIS